MTYRVSKIAFAKNNTEINTIMKVLTLRNSCDNTGNFFKSCSTFNVYL